MFKLCVFLFCFWLNFTLQSSIRMGIVTHSSYYGERELAWKIKLAAEQLGWKAFLDEEEGVRLQTMSHLDWVICLVPKNLHRIRRCPNYITIFDNYRYFNEEKKLLPFYKNYDGYLVTIPEEEFRLSLLEEKKDCFVLPFFPTVQDTPYQRVSLNSIVTTMPVWGDRLNKKKYKKLYRMLSESGCVTFYGRQSSRDPLQDGYIGALPFDGVSVIRAFQKHGIVLVLHSGHHLENKIPSARIFEAAAASAVIISDQNAFVQEHFSDSVYYIDTSSTSKNIYAQIMDCFRAIQENPEAALQKAAQAHQIFEEKFLMTSQLLQLHRKMHENKKNH